MKLIAAIILTVGLAIFVIGLIGVVRPFGRVSTRRRAAAWVGCGLAAMIAALVVGPEPEPKGATTASSGAAIPESTEEPEPPQPLYASIDGDDYLYSAGISDDARDAGQVAGQFIAFRYRGVKDGKITLTGNGMTLRCDENCTVITMTDQFGNKQHLEYNPSSVGGAAFADAMNGLLVERPSRKGKGDGK